MSISMRIYDPKKSRKSSWVLDEIKHSYNVEEKEGEITVSKYFSSKDLSRLGRKLVIQHLLQIRKSFSAYKVTLFNPDTGNTLFSVGGLHSNHRFHENKWRRRRGSMCQKFPRKPSCGHVYEDYLDWVKLWRVEIS